MLINYFRSALRNFSRNKGYALINILGLSLGITATIFILLYINDELGYDKHFPNYKRIYRAEGDFTINNKHDFYHQQQTRPFCHKFNGNGSRT